MEPQNILIKKSEHTSPFSVPQTLKRKGQPQKYKYLVKWARYSVSSNSWEPPKMFGATGKITLNNYQKKHGLPLTR